MSVSVAILLDMLYQCLWPFCWTCDVSVCGHSAGHVMSMSVAIRWTCYVSVCGHSAGLVVLVSVAILLDMWC